MDDRIPPPSHLQYSPSPVHHSSPHHHLNSMRYSASDRERYLAELLAERQKLAPFVQVLPFCTRLLNQEILRASTLPPNHNFVDAERIEHGSPLRLPGHPVNGQPMDLEGWSGMQTEHMGVLQASPMSWNGAPTHAGTPVVKKLVRLDVPVDKYPNFNFVGRLLGPRGNSLKRVEATTQCRVYIRGRGSVKDSVKAAGSWRSGGRAHWMQMPESQGLFEGLKAYRKSDGSILLFRPLENAMRMQTGAERMCMPAPPVEQFVDAVKQTVLANKRWVPPTGKGSLYIRPLLVGSGAVLGLAPAPEYTFIIFASPVGNYFKEGLAPINLIVEDKFHRATPGGTGGVKTIGNYASVLMAQKIAKEKGYSDVLYLDAVHKKYLEEVSSCNIFVVKGNVISTPAIKGTILPGITRKSIIDVALSKGFEVEERLLSVDELLYADEVFCTGTAVVVSPVGSITYQGKRIEYAGNQGVGAVSQQLYTSLTSLQMGQAEDSMGWTVQLN